MLVTNVVNNMYNASLDFNKILGDLLTQPKELSCAEIFNSGTSFLNILLKSKNPMCPKAVWDALIEATKDDKRFSTQLAFGADKKGWLPLHIAVDTTFGQAHTLDIVSDLVIMNPSALVVPVTCSPGHQLENNFQYQFTTSKPYKLPLDLCAHGEVRSYLERQTVSYLAWQIRRSTALSVARLMTSNVPTFARKRGGSGMRSKRGYFAFSVIAHFLTHGMEPLASEVFSYIGLNQNGPGVPKASMSSSGEIAHFRKQLMGSANKSLRELEKNKRDAIAKKKMAAKERQEAFEEKFAEFVSQGRSRAVASDLARDAAGISLMTQ